MRQLVGFAFALVVAGCALMPSPPSPAWGAHVPSPNPEAVANQPVVARGPSSITLLPISSTGATIGIAYGYDMPHCGVLSPIDVDGNFWDAVSVLQDAVAFDGDRGTFRLSTHDAAVFTGSNGHVLDLVRHAGAKEFPLCS